MKPYFRNLSYSAQIVILITVCAIFSFYLGLQDSKSQVIITGVILPIFIAAFSVLLNKIVESNKMYVNLRLYNYNQFKKSVNIGKDHLYKIFTNNEQKKNDCIFLEIENTGTTLISAIEIIINRGDPKKDKYYFFKSSLTPGHKEYIEIDYKESSINDILLITYLNNTDKLHYFNSITHIDNFTYFKDHSNKKREYNHRKIPSDNKINLYETYTKL